MVSEQDFNLISGNRYRGSRYANFAGGGVDPQGNVSSAVNENAATQTGSAGNVGDMTGGTAQPSQGLLGTGQTQAQPTSYSTPSMGQVAKNMVIGAGIPIAANAIGTAAGQALALGMPVTGSLSSGFSAMANRLSGGLVGSPATAPTNAALKAMGGNYGPATQSSVSKAAAGGNIGGAVGAGIGTAAATLLAGGRVKDAAKSGVGSAAGTYIGTAIGGPIGGFIGGFIGSTIFCFAAGTPILMQDNTYKPIEDLRLDDKTAFGGLVVARGEGYVTELYSYKGTKVTGGHAVFEDGHWLRVEDSALAELIPDTGKALVYPVCTENMILLTPQFIAADMNEISDPYDMTDDDIIVALNSMADRNSYLAEIQKEHCNQGDKIENQ